MDNTTVFDNGGRTTDRYAVAVADADNGYTDMLFMSPDPLWPQGVCLSDTVPGIVDETADSVFGTVIPFSELPAECRRAVLLWLSEDEGKGQER